MRTIAAILKHVADHLAELTQVIQEEAPDAIKNGEIKNHFGRKVAIVGSTKRFMGELD